MKTLFNYPVLIYFFATMACVSIMTIIDYILGREAEHLNAWVIINRLLGIETGIEDSLSIRYLGLVGATVLMILLNTVFGAILIQLIKLFMRIIHN